MAREILLLKETPSLGDAVQELLEAIGDQVKLARSPEEAASSVRAPGRFDVVISACNRRPSGLLRLLRDRPASGTGSVPVVFVGSPLDDALPPPCGPVHTVSLPLIPETFVSLLTRVAPGHAPETPPSPATRET